MNTSSNFSPPSLSFSGRLADLGLASTLLAAFLMVLALAWSGAQVVSGHSQAAQYRQTPSAARSAPLAQHQAQSQHTAQEAPAPACHEAEGAGQSAAMPAPSSSSRGHSAAWRGQDA